MPSLGPADTLGHHDWKNAEAGLAEGSHEAANSYPEMMSVKQVRTQAKFHKEKKKGTLTGIWRKSEKSWFKHSSR